MTWILFDYLKARVGQALNRLNFDHFDVLTSILELLDFTKFLPVLLIKPKWRCCTAQSWITMYVITDQFFMSSIWTFFVCVCAADCIRGRNSTCHLNWDQRFCQTVTQVFNLLGLAKGKWFPHPIALKSTSIYQTWGPKETGLIYLIQVPLTEYRHLFKVWVGSMTPEDQTVAVVKIVTSSI